MAADARLVELAAWVEQTFPTVGNLDAYADTTAYVEIPIVADWLSDIAWVKDNVTRSAQKGWIWLLAQAKGRPIIGMGLASYPGIGVVMAVPHTNAYQVRLIARYGRAP